MTIELMIGMSLVFRVLCALQIIPLPHLLLLSFHLHLLLLHFPLLVLPGPGLCPITSILMNLECMVVGRKLL